MTGANANHRDQNIEYRQENHLPALHLMGNGSAGPNADNNQKIDDQKDNGRQRLIKRQGQKNGGTLRKPHRRVSSWRNDPLCVSSIPAP